jgi:phenylacetate-CoA ligase
MIEKLYKKSPFFLKIILFNIKAYLNYKTRYNSSYNFYLNLYNSLLNKSRVEVLEYQKKELCLFMEESFLYSSFYKKRFEELSISLDEIKNDPYKVISKLPLLTKTDRKNHVDSIINTNPKRKTISIGFTSGTSGSPTKNYSDKDSLSRSFALWSRFHNSIGIISQDKSARFSGRIIINPNRIRSPFWVYNFIEKQLFMSMYHLTEKNISSYIKKLNKFSPVYLDGYPSAIYTIANYSLKNKIPITFKPKAICVTAETLFEYQRKIIEKAFHCKVYNQYASSEGSPFITECRYGKLHINEDSGFFEFLDNNYKPAKPGSIAKMVVTSFRNLKTPLIRYDIGDSVLLAESQEVCKCGSKMHYVEDILGRHDDILFTNEKGYIAGLNKAYIGIKGIVKSQIIQESLNLVVVKNVVDEEYSKKENEKFLINLKDRFGEKIEINIEIVDDIPLGANGKFNAVKRNFQLDN